MGRPIENRVILIALMAGIVTIAVIAINVLQDACVHTAVDPYAALAVFIPVLLVGIVEVILLKRRGLPIWPGILTTAVGCIGILLLLFLDRTNTLVQYEVWLQRGMP
jgi:hypothetical protein